MARKTKIEPIASRNYTIVIIRRPLGTWEDNISWFARNIQTCASTALFDNMEAYRNLKRTWRKSKQRFDNECRKMQFEDLFSKAGL